MLGQERRTENSKPILLMTRYKMVADKSIYLMIKAGAVCALYG